MFLYDAYCVARFSENECWFLDVCCLMVLLVCLLFISGQINFHDLEEDEHVTVETLAKCPEILFETR